MRNYLKEIFENDIVIAPIESIALNVKNVGTRYMVFVDMIIHQIASMFLMITNMSMIQGNYHRMYQRANNQAGGTARNDQ